MKEYLINPIRKKNTFIILCDAVLIFFVFLCSYVLRIALFEHQSILSLPTRVSWIVFPGIVIHLLCFYVFGLYEAKGKINHKIVLITVIFAVLTASAGVSILSYAFPTEKIGRILNLIHIFMMGTAVYYSRVLYAKLFVFGKSKEIIIVGWNSLVSKILKNLTSGETGYILRGIVVPPGYPKPETISNSVSVFKSIDEGLQTPNLKTVVISKQMKEIKAFGKKLIDLKFQGLDIYDGHSFYEHLLAKVAVSEASDDWLLYKSQNDSFRPNLYQKIKRILDILFSMLALLIMSPVLIFVSILIKIDSKGPVFFKQERLGQYESPFILLKYRTMRNNAEKISGPCWASEDDPRFTRIGKFLRKTRLDEFPQFFNVLKGDMSLVGPRPIRQHFADQFSEKFSFYRLRFKVKPGITGWAQANMDYVNTVEDQYEKLEYEFYYLYHQSLLLDMFILLKTVQSIFKMRGG